MTTLQQLAIAEDIICSQRTVQRWLQDPELVGANMRARLERAAKKLGIEIPYLKKKAA